MFTNDSHAQKHIMTGHVVAVETIRRGFFSVLFMGCGLNQPLLSVNLFSLRLHFITGDSGHSSLARLVFKAIGLHFLCIGCHLSLFPFV